MDKATSPYQMKMTASYTAMTEKKYEDVIKLSTEALNGFMESHVLELLNLRSTAYEKRGLLSRALEDAMLMVQYAPTSALGYLKVGGMQLLNGKSYLAAENYKQGLNLVPKSHSQYHQMHEEYTKALLRAQSRFDIVGNLPIELVHMILDRLESSESLWVCVTVSKKWYDQVTRSGSWWNSVTIKETGTNLDQEICNSIPLVKSFIAHLQLYPLLSNDLRKRHSAHLKNGGFTHIKSLSLKGTTYQLISPVDFAIALWQMRHSLTSLKLECGAKSYHLLDVLAACPNIEDLYYFTNGTILFTEESKNYASTVLCKKLSNLELYYGSSNATNTTYSALCFHIALCPNIRRLILQSPCAKPFIGGDPVGTTFTDYCPKLEILGLNCTEGLPEANEPDAHSASNEGLVCMSVKLSYYKNFRQILKHIDAQSHTLQRLNIVLMRTYEEQHYGYTMIPQQRAYPKLHTLQYTYYSAHNGSHDGQQRTITTTSATESLIVNIIQSSLGLSNLSLMCPSISMHFRTILEPIVKTKIQALTLKSTSFDNTTADWYMRLFSSLRQVQILDTQDCSFFDDNVMLALVESVSVQHLTITECKNISSIGLSNFLKEIGPRSPQQWHTLSLNGLSAALTTSAVRAIVKIKSLIALRITDDKNTSIEVISDLIGLAPGTNLKKIEFMNCSSAHNATPWLNSISCLKKKRDHFSHIVASTYSELSVPLVILRKIS